MPTSDSLSNQLNLIFANITRKTVLGMEQGLQISAILLKNEAVQIAPHHIGQYLQVGPIQSTPLQMFLQVSIIER